MPRLVSVITPCYNEEANVRELARAVKEIFAKRPEFEYEHIFIDNASADRTADTLRAMASETANVKVILNARNFGPIRSPIHAMLAASGDAVISIAADFQEPPELIATFLDEWARGAHVVVGVKNKSEEPSLFYWLRGRYYRFLARIADVQLVDQSTGFGLYDRTFMNALRRVDDPYPYFRGLVADIGFTPVQVPFTQPLRARGISSQNFYSLYDLAILGVVHHSKVPLRLATMAGVVMAGFSLLVAFGYLVYKLMFWNSFSLGVAPVLIGFFFISSVQLLFIGILGEYIGSIWTHVRHHPLVVERERINF